MKISWEEELRTSGVAVVRGVALDATNRELREIGAMLGSASLSGIHPGSPNSEEFAICRVEALEQPCVDPVGQLILSTSAAEFPLHTDDTFAPQPARWVLMHCWRADEAGGGVSRVSRLTDFLPQLSTTAVKHLKAKGFASPFGSAPVLFATSEADMGIRFNRRDFDSYAKRFGPPLSGPQADALDEVMAAANAHAREVALSMGDCLIVDNWRVLHGRTAFAAGSGRLLKRLRVV